MEDDRSYYARRAEAEWQAANASPAGETRRLHVELARMLQLRAKLDRPPKKPAWLK